MANLVYSAIVSLDGFIEDESGGFDWAVPDPETHAFVNELESRVGTYLYGRRMYETMAGWQTIGVEPTSGDGPVPPEQLDYADVWRAAEKVVYSRTLPAVSTPHTLLEREFDPERVVRMKDAADRDISVSGPGLAQSAFEAGLVDEIRLFVLPVIVGGGRTGLPRGVRLDLSLVEKRPFRSGVVHMHYASRNSAP